MSNSDKAKSKLLDSMRMSKQGVTADVTTEAKNVEPEKIEPAKKVKATASKPARPSNKSKPAAKNATAKSSSVKKPVIDNFQAAQRVWPD